MASTCFTIQNPYKYWKLIGIEVRVALKTHKLKCSETHKIQYLIEMLYQIKFQNWLLKRGGSDFRVVKHRSETTIFTSNRGDQKSQI